MFQVIQLIMFGLLAFSSGMINAESDKQPQLFLSAVEIKAGKAIVEKHCVQCHGMLGISDNEIIPHLGGQHISYLYKQLKAYQSGERVDAKMRLAMGSLSDDALIQAAAYYASMEPIRISPDAVKTNTQYEENPLETGKTLAATCSACHGTTGNGAFPGMPVLTGISVEYLSNIIHAYKSGKRQDAMMQMAVSALNDDQIESVALFYALQEPKESSTPTMGNADSGKSLSSACASCHGENGVSSNATPSLAGQDLQYLVKATTAYKNGSRNHSLMSPVVEALTDENIKDLAAFYSAQAGVKPNVRLPLTTEQWAEKCDRCHGYNGNSRNPNVPIIAGQRQDYLIKALTDYKANVRSNTMMHAMSEPLSEREITNIAAHYASKQGRAVILVEQNCK